MSFVISQERWLRINPWGNAQTSKSRQFPQPAKKLLLIRPKQVDRRQYSVLNVPKNIYFSARPQDTKASPTINKSGVQTHQNLSRKLLYGLRKLREKLLSTRLYHHESQRPRHILLRVVENTQRSKKLERFQPSITTTTTSSEKICLSFRTYIANFAYTNVVAL